MTLMTPSLSFSEAVNASTSNIFQIHGRSRRSEFWWTHLLVYVLSFFLTPIVGFLLDILTIPLAIRRLHDTGRSGWWWVVGALSKLSFFVLLFYDICMAVVNADDISGYADLFFAAMFIKYTALFVGIGIYQLVLLVFYCLDSESFENYYGPSPKYQDGEEDETEVDEEDDN